MSHSADNPTLRPRRSWPWIVAVLVAVVAIVVGASVVSTLLAAEDSPAAQPPPVTSAPPSSAAPSPTPTASPSATSTARPELDDDDLDAIETAVEDVAFADLYDYLADPVHVAIAASDFDSDRSRDNAIIDLEYLADASGWDWDLDDETISAFQAGSYAQHFGAGTIVGESSEGYVVSFEVESGRIVGIFLSNSASVVSK